MLTLLALLTLLSLLALLALLPLLTCWLIAAQLLALLALGHLLQLLLQLLGFAAQHLLLPALLRGLLLALLLLLGQFLLALGQLLQLLQRLVDLLLLLLLLAGRLRLVALVLVLLGIEFEIEEAFHVARAGAAAAAAATAADCRTPPGYRGRWLRRASGIAAPSAPAPARPATWRPSTCPWPDPWPPRPSPYPSTKLLKESPASVNWRAFMRSASDFAWSRSLDCTLARNAAFSASRALGARALQLIPGGRDDFLLALRNLVLILVAAAAAATAARLLRLRVVALERLRFDEVDVGAGGGARVLGHGVQADHVARLHLEIFQRDACWCRWRSCRPTAWRRPFPARRSRSSAAPRSSGRNRPWPPPATVTSSIGRRFEIAARPGDLDLRRIVLLRLDEVIFAEADVVAAFERGDVIQAVLLDRHGGRQQAVGARCAASAWSHRPASGRRWPAAYRS